MRILNNAIKYRRTFTLISRKLLSRDTNNFVELYMLSVSQIQATKKQEILVEKFVYTYSSDYTIDNKFDKTWLSIDHANSC